MKTQTLNGYKDRAEKIPDWRKRKLALTLLSYLEENNLSINGLADFLGVSRFTIKNWLNGNSAPDLQTLCVVCDRLKYDLDKMFGKLEEKTHDIKDICNMTGLSENAVELLIEPMFHTPCGDEEYNDPIHENIIDAINSLCSIKEEARELFVLIDAYFHFDKKTFDEKYSLSAQYDGTVAAWFDADIGGVGIENAYLTRINELLKKIHEHVDNAQVKMVPVKIGGNYIDEDGNHFIVTKAPQTNITFMEK